MTQETINTTPISIEVVNNTDIPDDVFKEVVDGALSDINHAVLGRPISHMILYLQILMIVGTRCMARYKICSEDEIVSLARVNYRGFTDTGRG